MTDRRAADDTALAGGLAERLTAMIDIPSPSRDEDALAAYVLDALGPLARDAGDSCVLTGPRSRNERPLVLLAGHLDTVPEQGNLPSRRAEGVVSGLGAADMKGALAVMIELALAMPADAGHDLGLVFFPREELPFGDTALSPLLDREPGLRTADLAIVMEPTAGAVQLGCLGNLNATWTISGSAGHSARPWLADNAIERAARAIAALPHEPVDHVFHDLTYREVVSPVVIHGGVAKNVIPDTCVVELNHRYAPGTSAAEAEANLRRWCEPHGSLSIDGNAPSGAVPDGNGIAERLIAISGRDAEPKQAWTPVAEFARAGVDAVNFGPGDPAYAHRRDEQVSEQALVECYRALEELVRVQH